MAERGVIVHRDLAARLRDFSGLRFGNITPTDIDAFSDFGNKVFIFVEYKHGTASLPYGQRLAMERLCDATQRGGIESYYIVANYSATNDKGDIPCDTAQVNEFRWNGKWHKATKPTTVREAHDAILERHAEKKIA